jgi:anti-sigma-K factor RskA
MSCEEIRDHYELYAMGVAEDPEREEIRRHLHRGCEVCMAGMNRARQLTAAFGAAAELQTPSPRLRRRILASAGHEERRFSWGLLAATAAAVLCFFGAVYFSGRERAYVEEVARLRDQMRGQTLELTRLNEAFTILSAPGTTETSFGPGQPKGKVFVHPRQGVLMIASNLPPVAPGKIYEMWVIPKGGKPAPAGLFRSSADGTAVHVQQGPVDVSATAAVAVTLEDEAGATAPTSQPFIVAALQ